MRLAARRPPPPGEVERVMGLFDKNADGRVSWEEFRVTLAEMKAKPKSGAASGATEFTSCECGGVVWCVSAVAWCGV